MVKMYVNYHHICKQRHCHGFHFKTGKISRFIFRIKEGGLEATLSRTKLQEMLNLSIWLLSIQASANFSFVLKYESIEVDSLSFIVH